MLIVWALLAAAMAQETPAANDFELVKVSSYASCSVYQVQDSAGQEVPLPDAVRDALDCPLAAGVHGQVLIYLHQGLRMMHRDLLTGAERELFEVYPDMDGVSGPIWSPDGQIAAFLIINQKKTHGYTTPSRIMAVSVIEGPIRKVHFDRPVEFVCGSTCGLISQESLRFTDDTTLRYRVHPIALPERAGETEDLDLSELTRRDPWLSSALSIRTVPHRDGHGDFDGFRLSNIRRDSVWKELDVQNGDILKEIRSFSDDGTSHEVEIKNTDTGTQLLRELFSQPEGGQRVELLLNRYGEPQTRLIERQADGTWALVKSSVHP
jgi:hypothetical protein